MVNVVEEKIKVLAEHLGVSEDEIIELNANLFMVGSSSYEVISDHNEVGEYHIIPVS